jgi:glycosyltransferase involved in cell wall biosynthesis
MKVALVHDWLVAMRGGERVLEELCVLFPNATLFTLFHRRGAVSERIESMPIRVSPLNRLAGSGQRYRNWLPLFPWAISRFDLSGFDLILSNSHAVAKGVRKPSGAVHICSCLTPMRYLWDMAPDYFQYGDPLGLRRAAFAAVKHPLRSWDRKTAQYVDHFIANSKFVQARIERCYGRQAEVVYSPVNTRFFTPAAHDAAPRNLRSENEFFLIVSALVPYKRVDLAVDAFKRLGRRLVVVGGGPDLRKLKNRSSSNVVFRGFVSNEELRDLYRSCSAVLIPGREDFGLVALEAQACGRPAIAYGAGGSLESVAEGDTGVLFSSQSVEAVVEAVERFDRGRFVPERLRANAERFSTERFRTQMHQAVMEKWHCLRERRS